MKGHANNHTGFSGRTTGKMIQGSKSSKNQKSTNAPGPKKKKS